MCKPRRVRNEYAWICLNTAREEETSLKAASILTNELRRVGLFEAPWLPLFYGAYWANHDRDSSALLIESSKHQWEKTSHSASENH